MTEKKHHVLHIIRSEWRKTCKTPIQMVLMIAVPFLTILFLFWGLHYIREVTNSYAGLVYCENEAQCEELQKITEEYDSFDCKVGDSKMARSKIHDGKYDVVLVILPDEVTIVYDTNLLTSSVALKDGTDLASEISFFLEGEELHESYLEFLPEMDIHDLSTDEERLESDIDQIAGTMGMILFLSMASNAMTLSGHSITGEKERQTFDTLVLCPTPLRKILLGKISVMTFQIFLAGLMGTIGILAGMGIWNREDFRMIAAANRGDLRWILVLLALLVSASALITGIFSIIASAFPETKKTALFGSAGMIVISFAAMAPSFSESTMLKYLPVMNFAPIIQDTCQHKIEAAPLLASMGIAVLILILCVILSSGLWERSRE